jgi:ADP-ribosylglycohydrolase
MGSSITEILSRAQATLLGQVAGDSLGSLVEFKSSSEILSLYPNGVRELANGGTFNTLAGQPTDDSEMALLLARTLADKGDYNASEVRRQYVFWLESNPFDCGNTIAGALRGRMDPESQANGALMRVSPIGVFGVNYPLEQVAEWAEADAALTHPNPVCIQVNALFAMAISTAISESLTSAELYQKIKAWAKERYVEASVIRAIDLAATETPQDFMQHMGWVLIAFQNALYQLLHAPSLEKGVVDTVMRGGDTDTNAAITGALLGALYGRAAIPVQWQRAILSCQPLAGTAGIFRPRPRCFWPVDVLELAGKLASA